MLPGKRYSTADALAVARRHKWLIVLPFAVGLSAMPFLARLVPKEYRSETLIRVIPQRVPDNYVRSNVTTSVENRLPAITDVILSRSWLERIILEFNLYAHQRQAGLLEEAIGQMRDKDVSVK